MTTSTGCPGYSPFNPPPPPPRSATFAPPSSTPPTPAAPPWLADGAGGGLVGPQLGGNVDGWAVVRRVARRELNGHARLARAGWSGQRDHGAGRRAHKLGVAETKRRPFPRSALLQ